MKGHSLFEIFCFWICSLVKKTKSFQNLNESRNFRTKNLTLKLYDGETFTIKSEMKNVPFNLVEFQNRVQDVFKLNRPFGCYFFLNGEEVILEKIGQLCDNDVTVVKVKLN